MFHERMDTIAESWDFCDQIAKHYAKGHSTYIVENGTTILKLWPDALPVYSLSTQTVG